MCFAGSAQVHLLGLTGLAAQQILSYPNPLMQSKTGGAQWYALAAIYFHGI